MRHRAPVVVEHVSKWYRHWQQRPSLAEQLLRRASGTRQPSGGFWSLRDVSLEVAGGESMGLLGENGAGKTTLLKIIAGIACPTSGRVNVGVPVSTHLGFGSGFNRLLTGRENVFLQGTILGLTNQEVRRLYGQIVAFSGLDGSIDRPLWTYSSGMVARLGFAVAAHASFGLLLLDEALATGDQAFRVRCDRTLEALRAGGRTMVIASHNLPEVRRLCDRALWLEQGVVRAVGPAAEVTRVYQDALHARSASATSPPGSEG